MGSCGCKQHTLSYYYQQHPASTQIRAHNTVTNFLPPTKPNNPARAAALPLAPVLVNEAAAAAQAAATDLRKTLNRPMQTSLWITS